MLFDKERNSGFSFDKGKEVLSSPYMKILIMVLAIFAFSSNVAWIKHRVVKGKYSAWGLPKKPPFMWQYNMDSIALFSSSAAFPELYKKNPDKYFVWRMPKKIPFMWQYDMDSIAQLSSAAVFPEFYRKNPELISRPAYPMAAYIIGKSIGIVLTPLLDSDFVRHTFRRMGLPDPGGLGGFSKKTEQTNGEQLFTLRSFIYASIGFIVLKLAIYMLAGVLMFRILKEFFDESVALLSLALLFFSGYSINAIATYHTYELEFITPIIIVYLFLSLAKSYSIRKNIAFSLIVGILMLGKANYAAYLAVLIYAMTVGGFKAVVVSSFAHLIPWVIWQVFLEMNGMSIIGIVNEPQSGTLALHPADIIGRKLLNLGVIGGSNQPGALVVQGLDDFNPIRILQIITTNFTNSVRVFGSIWGFLAVAAVPLYKHHHKKEVLVFSLLFLSTTWIQALISFPLGPKSRVLLDPSFIIYGFAAYTIYQMLAPLLLKHRRILIWMFLFVYILCNLLLFVKFPWVHPFDQINDGLVKY